MKRAYLIEMTVLRDYARQLFSLGIFVAICTSLGTQSTVPIAGVLACMYLIMGTMAGSSYDEQNNWGLYRLTMPVSRRDVVLGRYGVIVTLGLLGAVAGMIGALAISAVAGVAPLPGDLSEAFGLTPDTFLLMLFTLALCLFIGSLVAAIETPVYFRFGQTKATQWIPLLSVMLFVAPMVLLGAAGQIGEGGIKAIKDLVVFVSATPAGAVAFLATSIVLGAVALGISAAISLKLYQKREL